MLLLNDWCREKNNFYYELSLWRSGGSRAWNHPQFSSLEMKCYHQFVDLGMMEEEEPYFALSPSLHIVAVYFWAGEGVGWLVEATDKS